MPQSHLSLFSLFALFFSAAFGITAQASGLVVHAEEWGVAKFHRYDNSVHAYDGKSAWLPYVLPANAQYGAALSWNNADGSVTVVYSTLDELIRQVTAAAQAQGQKISVLNVHGHGLPGAMWFPATDSDLNDLSCGDWVQAASGADTDNYNQYYSAVSEDEVNEIRQISNSSGFRAGCTTGLREWQAGVAKTPAFRDALADDVQIHFLSCVVGLGSVGDQFSTGVASAVIAGTQGKVEASTNFGLGDWSMPEGMGFWDLVTSDQLEHDNSVYVVDKKDREIMQKGTLRVVTQAQGTWSSSLWADRDFMSLGYETAERGIRVLEPRIERSSSADLPPRVRIPGTSAYVQIRH